MRSWNWVLRFQDGIDYLILESAIEENKDKVCEIWLNLEIDRNNMLFKDNIWEPVLVSYDVKLF